MLTVRNLRGVALFLMGSTWLWLTPEFAGRDVATSGVMWSVTRVLCLLTVAGFCVATWGLFTHHSWWEAVALGSAAVGVLALLTFRGGCSERWRAGRDRDLEPVRARGDADRAGCAAAGPVVGAVG
jgi:hypothetical protein